MKLKSLDKVKKMVGKTVASVGMRSYDSELLISFTDGTFIVFDGSIDCDGEAELNIVGNAEKYWSTYYLALFQVAGIITQEEFDQINMENVAQGRKDQEKAELAQFLRLKEKYE